MRRNSTKNSIGEVKDFDAKSSIIASYEEFLERNNGIETKLSGKLFNPSSVIKIKPGVKLRESG